jgi:RNA polymerase sigma-70 factor (ECF subfamily)
MTTHASMTALVRTCDEPPDIEAARIARARRDPAAFARLYERHHEAIYRYLCRRTGNPHDAEDLAGEVFLTAMRSIHRYRDTGAGLRAWLYGVATNHANRWARDWRRRRRRPMPADLEHAPPDARSDADRAQRALLALPARFQAVIVLHHLEGLGVEEVARAVGRPVGTVKSRLKRGRDAMRRELERPDRALETHP